MIPGRTQGKGGEVRAIVLSRFPFCCPLGEERDGGGKRQCCGGWRGESYKLDEAERVRGVKGTEERAKAEAMGINK